MGKLIIRNQSSESDEIALQYVLEVMKKGRISKDGTQYCYATKIAFKGHEPVMVFTDLNKESDRFTVLDYKGP